MTINEEDRKAIRQFEEIMKRNHYVKSSTLQIVYNRVFQTNLSSTQCGTCLRGRTKKLIDALNKLEAEEREALKNAQESGFTTVEEAKEETKKIMEEHKEEVENVVSGKPSRTVKARKKTKPKAT